MAAAVSEKHNTDQAARYRFDATVAILTFNGEEFMDDLLKALHEQNTTRRFEILVIDSGSTDQTVEIAKSYPKVRLHHISNKEFGHGKTRNLAVSLADSEYVLFLTQDAVPAHEGWLDYMLEPFSISEKVGCVFGRQIPRPHCFVSLKREVDAVFKSFGDNGSISLQRQTTLTEELGLTNNYLSDVNSAFRKRLHAKVPFQDLNYAEDQAIGIDMLDAGYFKAYAPLGSVYHSHDYPLGKYFRRKFDEYVGLRKSTGYIARVGLRDMTLGVLKATLKDWLYLVRDRDFSPLEKIHDFFYAPLYNIALRRAIRKAAVSLTEEDIARHSLEVAARKKAAK